MDRIVEVLNVNINTFNKLIADAKSNVIGVGVGNKLVNGKSTAIKSIVYFVEKKLPKSELRKKDILPTSVDGVLTDVVETGRITIGTPKALGRTDKHRPAPGGVSIGHKDITAGTLGCLVRKGDTTYILSNNHVLANSNAANIGDAILQPGPHDGGTAGDQIGILADYAEISFGDDGIPDIPECPITGGIARVFNLLATVLGRKSRLNATKVIQATTNLVDAAIATPLNIDDVKAEIFELCIPEGVGEAPVGTPIRKSGRTTEVTTGTVDYTDVTVQVGYGDNRTATFSDQLMAGAMSAGGDSGSAVLDMQGRVVGLLFAGSDTTTIINKIGNVMSALGLDGVVS